MPVTYPGTNLTTDIADAPYGGVPANRWGTPARQYVDVVLQFLGKAYLKYLRVEYLTHAVILSSNCNVGDVAVFDTGHFVSASGYWARNALAASGGATNALVWGVFIEAGSVGARVRVATHGVLAPSITGLGLQTAGTPVGVDFTLGKLRVAINGDPIVGYCDIQGNVLLLAPGHLL